MIHLFVVCVSSGLLTTSSNTTRCLWRESMQISTFLGSYFIYSHSVHSLVTETSFFAPYSESILCSFSVSRNGKADCHLFENINSTKCLGTVWETQDTAVEQWSSHQHWTWLWNILYKSLAAQLWSFWSFVSREIFFFLNFSLHLFPGGASPLGTHVEVRDSLWMIGCLLSSCGSQRLNKGRQAGEPSTPAPSPMPSENSS